MSDFPRTPEFDFQSGEMLDQINQESFTNLIDAARNTGLDTSTEAAMREEILQDLAAAYEDLQTIDESLKQFWDKTDEAAVLELVHTEHLTNPAHTLRRTVALARIKRFFFESYSKVTMSQPTLQLAALHGEILEPKDDADDAFEENWYEKIQSKPAEFVSWIDMLLS